ncbi:MAG TPA: hypothetical protein VGM92_00715 [Candidatus Kapabacteria bacterium]|jgi:negative regulator of sigma E activity
MKTNNHGAAAPVSTTEELIVQYLDGELVRKELETVLFDRLAHSEEARTLLREYLVVRGAIRMTREDERFQLSDELDSRTRARIEQMMEALEKEPRRTVGAGFLRDKDSIVTVAAERRTGLWTRRVSYAAFGMLLLLGAWFTGQREGRHAAKPLVAQSSITVPSMEPQQADVLPIASETDETNPVLEKAHTVARRDIHIEKVEKASRPATSPSPSGTLAQTPARSTPAASVADPADVMLSQRFTKAINSAKNEVVVTSRDRM